MAFYLHKAPKTRQKTACFYILPERSKEGNFGHFNALHNISFHTHPHLTEYHHVCNINFEYLVPPGCGIVFDRWGGKPWRSKLGICNRGWRWAFGNGKWQLVPSVMQAVRIQHRGIPTPSSNCLGEGYQWLAQQLGCQRGYAVYVKQIEYKYAYYKPKKTIYRTSYYTSIRSIELYSTFDHARSILGVHEFGGRAITHLNRELHGITRSTSHSLVNFSLGLPCFTDLKIVFQVPNGNKHNARSGESYWIAAPPQWAND